MPIVSTTSKKHIESAYNLIAMLQEKCESCKIFRGQTAKETYIYSVCNDYSTDDGPAMVAIAKFGDDTYAIQPPQYLTDEQFGVFEFVLRDIKPDDKIVVFSLESYNALGKYSYGKPINVRLYV